MKIIKTEVVPYYPTKLLEATVDVNDKSAPGTDLVYMNIGWSRDEIYCYARPILEMYDNGIYRIDLRVFDQDELAHIKEQMVKEYDERVRICKRNIIYMQ